MIISSPPCNQNLSVRNQPNFIAISNLLLCNETSLIGMSPLFSKRPYACLQISSLRHMAQACFLLNACVVLGSGQRDTGHAASLPRCSESGAGEWPGKTSPNCLSDQYWGVSLVVQWLRLHLPLQGPRWDPWSGNETPHTTAKPVCRN